MRNNQIGPKGSRGDPPIASGSRGQPPWIINDPWGELPVSKWKAKSLPGFPITKKVKGDAIPSAVINPDGGIKNDKNIQL